MLNTSRRRLVAALAAATTAGTLALVALGGPGGLAGTAGKSAPRDVPAGQVAAAADAGDGTKNPLTNNEIQQAQDLAAAAANTRLRATPAGRQASRPEVLLTDRRAIKSSTARQADVYLYDYGTDQGMHAVVDLAANKVLTLTSERGLQPAPSPAETSRAVKILMDDAGLGPKLRAMYKDATGQELTAPNDVWSQALIFKAKRHSGVAGVARAAQCGEHRCFQLFVRVPGGKWVDTRRVVVDMSAQRAIVLG